MIAQQRDSIDFDYEGFKRKAESENFFGQVIQEWANGKLVFLTVTVKLKPNDFYKLLDFHQKVI
jgi:hypothetical protein